MSDTRRNVPHWAKREAEAGYPWWWNSLRHLQLTKRGADGVFCSEVAIAAKDGKLDNRSTAPRGKSRSRSKQLGSRQVRLFAKRELRRDLLENLT